MRGAAGVARRSEGGGSGTQLLLLLLALVLLLLLPVEVGPQLPPASPPSQVVVAVLLLVLVLPESLVPSDAQQGERRHLRLGLLCGATSPAARHCRRPRGDEAAARGGPTALLLCRRCREAAVGFAVHTVAEGSAAVVEAPVPMGTDVGN